MSEEEYLTIKEAAKRLKRHPRTVWNWTVEGKISYHQLFPGAKILIPLSEIMKFADPEDRYSLSWFAKNNPL
jgi:excisionase family DNA binding protein